MDGLSVPRAAAWRRAWRALRGSGWWYFCLLPLVSVVGDARGDSGELLRLAGSVVVAGLCLAYAYGFNGITDRAMDRDAAKNSLAGLVEELRDAEAPGKSGLQGRRPATGCRTTGYFREPQYRVCRQAQRIR